MQRQLSDEEDRAIDILTGVRKTAVCLLADFDEEEGLTGERGCDMIEFDTCGTCGDEYCVQTELDFGNTANLCRYHWVHRFGHTSDSDSDSDSDSGEETHDSKRAKSASEVSIITSSFDGPMVISTDGNLMDGRTAPSPDHTWNLMSRKVQWQPGFTSVATLTPGLVNTVDGPLSSFKKEILGLNLMMEDPDYRRKPRCEGCRNDPFCASQMHHMGLHGCLSK